MTDWKSDPIYYPPVSPGKQLDEYLARVEKRLQAAIRKTIQEEFGRPSARLRPTLTLVPIVPGTPVLRAVRTDEYNSRQRVYEPWEERMERAWEARYGDVVALGASPEMALCEFDVRFSDEVR